MFWILIALVVIAPLPFGAVQPWAWGSMGVAVGGLLLGWSATLIVTRQPPAVAVARIWPILLLFGIAVVWVLLQMAPFMPAGLHHPLWADAAAARGLEVGGGTVSIDPFETGSALVRLLTYGGIFWLALQYGRDRDRARIAFYALALAGLAYAAYGLIIEFSGARMILWYPKTAYGDVLTSTFVNRNSYATYAGIGLLVTTALLVRIVASSTGGADHRRERLLRLITAMSGHGWVLLLAWASLATALLLTDSRGGFLATATGLIALIGAFAATRVIRRRHSLMLGGMTIAAGLVFFALSGGTVTERLANTDFERENRLKAYQLTLDAAGDVAWTGSGYGSYQEVFRMYRDETIPGVYDKAHNTYLELALELGLPVSAALVLAVAIAGATCAAGIRRRRRDTVYPAVGLAVCVLAAVHSMVDFSFQIPAIGATFAFILGISCAQSWSSGRQT